MNGDGCNPEWMHHCNAGPEISSPLAVDIIRWAKNNCNALSMSLSTVVLNSRDWPRKNGIQNFDVSKIHLRAGVTQKNPLKCIGKTIITLYLC